MKASVDTVIFVCDKVDSLYADKPLVGTGNYRTFLEYLDILLVSVNDTLLYHEDDVNTIEAIASTDSGVRVITLGSAAEINVSSLTIPHMSLPLNAVEIPTIELKSRIAEVRDFIHDYQNQ